MTLSCFCDGDYDSWYRDAPGDFIKFEGYQRRKRCISCGKFIDHGTDCLRFDMYRIPHNDIEEDIYGDEVPLAPKFMCESCGEIFLNLSSLGYCLDIGHHVKEDLREYWELTGFEPKEKGGNDASAH